MNQIGNKRLIINLSANIVSYSTNILIAFVLTPYLINTLGKETYSFYPIANNFVAYMCILTNALNSMSSRFVMVSYVKGHMEDVKKFISSVLFSNMIMAMLLLIPMVFIVIFINKIMDVPINIIASVRILFAFVFSSLLINILSSVFGVATFVKNRIDLRSIMQLAAGILKILMFYILFKLSFSNWTISTFNYTSCREYSLVNDSHFNFNGICFVKSYCASIWFYKR